MSTFEEDFSKLSPEQQAEYIRQAQKIHGAANPDPLAADWARLPYMNDHEVAAFKAKVIPTGDKALADAKAKRAAEARGFEVTKKA